MHQAITPEPGGLTLPLRAAALLLLLSACSSASNPAPSAGFDGRYAGTRSSNLPEECGAASARGRASATVRDGRLAMQLFGPDSRLSGTVGEDGALRASGLWRTPRGFNNVTVLRGQVASGVLTGTATDLRCVTELSLRRLPS